MALVVGKTFPYVPSIAAICLRQHKATLTSGGSLMMSSLDLSFVQDSVGNDGKATSMMQDCSGVSRAAWFGTWAAKHGGWTDILGEHEMVNPGWPKDRTAARGRRRTGADLPR